MRTSLIASIAAHAAMISATVVGNVFKAGEPWHTATLKSAEAHAQTGAKGFLGRADATRSFIVKAAELATIPAWLTVVFLLILTILGAGRESMGDVDLQIEGFRQ